MNELDLTIEVKKTGELIIKTPGQRRKGDFRYKSNNFGTEIRSNNPEYDDIHHETCRGLEKIARAK